MSMDEELLDWSNKQASILTGGGTLASFSTLNTHYFEHELPHHHLRSRNTRQTFAAWIENDRRHLGIVGCWSRPLFAGGWLESTDADTEAYNLQTPSFFIDMRFPCARPSLALAVRGSLAACSDLELRYLARQHCFGGYSYPSIEPDGLLHFTRHHIIDWNYHPAFPRMRPNKRWVVLQKKKQQEEEKEEACVSFKEYSFARDDNGVPVYFERWQRRENDSLGSKYLAFRRKTPCPATSSEESKNIRSNRDALLVVVGSHFAFCVDRKQPVCEFSGAQGPGGPPLVDFALSVGDRVAAESYLDLEGSYGHLLQLDEATLSWRVAKSTFPWKEGTDLFTDSSSSSSSGAVGEQYTSGIYYEGDRLVRVCWQGQEWQCFENTFSKSEIRRMFSFALGPMSNL